MSVLAERFAAQGLTGPPVRDPVAVVERLLAVQAQDPRGARLAIRARSTGLHARDVDAALDSRALVVTWLNRGTLHLVRAEDYGWLQALTTPPLYTGNARRLAQEDVTPAQADKGVRVISRALHDGPLTRRQLAERVAAQGVPTQGQAFVQVLFLASLRGLVVRGPMVGKEQAYVLVHDWLGPAKPVDRDVALAELARRYLAGHGPASAHDLAKWAGLPLRDARAGVRAIASSLAGRDDGLAALTSAAPEAGLPAPRLLGAFEPVLLGWVSREPLVGRYADRVMSGGMFRPFALVGGRSVATWALVGGRVEIEPFERLPGAALAADAVAVTEYLGSS